MHVWVEVNVGGDRSGLRWDQPDAVVGLAAQIARAPAPLRFGGLYAHAGHTYNAPTTAAIREVFRTSAARMQSLREAVRAGTGADPALGYGDTPSCSLVEDLSPFHMVCPVPGNRGAGPADHCIVRGRGPLRPGVN